MTIYFRNLIWLLLFLSLYLYLPDPLLVTYANQEDSSFINSMEEDITGDGFHEYINMQGKLLGENSEFYRDVWIDIQSPFKKQWSISLQNGYEPQIELIDLNHDQVFDIFYQIRKDRDNKNFHYQLYTLKGGEVTSIPLPKHVYTQGKFVNNFKAQVRLHPQKQPYIIDLADKKDDYIHQQLYDDKGALTKKQDIIIKSISKLAPVLISESKGYGLESTQLLKGMNEEDTIGTIETLWYFKNNEWIILKSEIKPF